MTRTEDRNAVRNLEVRTFEDKPAVREETPLLIGAVGPSGSGKTYSLLRLATGIQRVTGGEIFVVDTEGRRALHYADKFTFRHVPMGAPFSPGDYMLAFQHCLKKAAATSNRKPIILTDSLSHEHEGVGGVLEWHERELDRMAGNDLEKRNKMTFAAWAKPKKARQDLINFILQQNADFLFGFRAKKKTKKKGRELEERGFEAISGENWIYEMTLKCLLLPGSNGVPTWRSDLPGEQELIKIPEQFRSIFSSSPQLTEDIGQALAAWAAGVAAPKPATAAELLASYSACSDPATFQRIESQRSVSWPKLTKEEKRGLVVAKDEAKERIERASRTFDDSETEGGSDDSNEPGSDDDENEAA